MDDIIVEKKTSKENKVLVVYDIFDKDVGTAITQKNAHRKHRKEYEKTKIPKKANQIHRYFVKKMKELVEAQGLYGANNQNELSVEYLTFYGWVGHGNTFRKGQEKSMYSLPQADRDNPSGEENNALDPDEQVLIARVNVFSF